MDKAEYTFRLRSGLLNYPESFRNEIMESFETHYASGVAQGKRVSAILEEFGDPEVLLKEIDELYHNHADKAKIDALWVSKNRDLMRNLTDFKMGASILIPALFVLMIILHQLGII